MPPLTITYLFRVFFKCEASHQIYSPHTIGFCRLYQANNRKKPSPTNLSQKTAKIIDFPLQHRAIKTQQEDITLDKELTAELEDVMRVSLIRV